MDNQTLINVLIAFCGALLGWVLKGIRESIVDLQGANKDLTKADSQLLEKVQTIEVLVAGTYVKRNDMEKLSDGLFKKLDSIEQKLDKKADK